MDMLLIVGLLISTFSSWLVARAVFIAMNKAGSKWANTVSVFTALVLQVAIFILLVIAVSSVGGFRR